MELFLKKSVAYIPNKSSQRKPPDFCLLHHPF